MGEQVIWSIPWMWRKLAKVSDKKGGPLSEKNHLSSPYCEIRSCKHCTKLSEVLEWVLKGAYLLKGSVIRRYSLLLLVKWSPATSCHGLLGISLGKIDCTA